MDFPELVLALGEYEVRADQLRRRSPCRTCGAPIVWHETTAGRRMPLAARTGRACRCPDCLGAEQRIACARCRGVGLVFAVLNHWADCPRPPARRAVEPGQPGE